MNATNRDLGKYVADYKSQFMHKDNHNKGALYQSDYTQIYQMSNDPDKTIGGRLYNAIDNALMAGFMIGYKCAKREAKRGQYKHGT